MTLPLVKLATIAIKQLAKPLANGIKRAVRTNEYMTSVILYPAQAYHRLEQTVRMRFMGWTGKVEVKPLSKEAAVDLGAELVGELVIFSVAVGTLYAEVKRGQGKDKRKEDEQNAKLFTLQEQITDLALESSKQNAQIKELTRLLNSLDDRIPKK